MSLGNATSRFLIRLETDFNDINGDVLPLLIDSWLRLRKGQAVCAYDSEGNEMDGTIKRLTSWGCYARMDRASWREGQK